MTTINSISGSCCGRLVCALLVGAATLLAGCGTLFDSPPSPETLRQEAAARKISGLVSGGEQTESGTIPAGLREVGVTPQDVLNSPSGALSSVTNKATNMATDSATDAAHKGVASLGASVNTATATRAASSDDAAQAETPTGRKIPVLSFERADADMPHLAVRGLDDAVFWIDGKEMALGGMTRIGRMGLVAPGRHILKIECPRDPPFSADFQIRKNERVVVRGNCSPPPTLNNRR